MSVPGVSTTLPPELQLWQMASGHWLARAIHVAAQLGVADYLTDGPLSVHEIARLTGTHERSLYRLLRTLSSVGIFKESDSRTFELTPLAEPLVSNAPNSIRNGPMFLGEHLHWSSWGELMHSVKTGESAFQHVFGKEMFAYFADHPAEAVPFDRWMSQLSHLTVPSVVSAYDFSQYKVITDIGGGQGRLLAAILAQASHSKGILFDAPHVVANESMKDNSALSGRYEAVGGDFFQSVPPGADLYVLKQVIHDWGDDLAARILANCRAGMGPGSKLLLIEMVIPDMRKPHPGFTMDLNMLVLTPGGVERTESEYRTLLNAAGIALNRVIPTSSPFSLLEGVGK